MKNNNPLISVIVPVYNVEQYLKKCVDSIINQTYLNIEILLVDDGSTDNSGKICDEIKKRDKRIKVIHKENGGLSDARNTGLDIFKGEYVTFVDSDDWINEEYISYLYGLIKKYNVELSVCEIINITDSGKILNKNLENLQEFTLDEKEAVHELLKSELFSTSVCGKLYNRKIFLNRRFPIGKLYEDIPVTYDILLKGVKLAFGARGLYYYLTRNNSITTIKFKPSRMDAIFFVEDAMEKVALKYPEFKEEINIRIFCAYFALLNSFGNDKDSIYYKRVTLSKLRKLRIKVLFSKKSTRMQKIKALCSFLNYRIIQGIILIRKM